MADAVNDNQLERFRLAVDAVQQSLARHSVTLLIWGGDPNVPSSRGSATCVELGGVHYLLTAAHVVQSEEGKPLDVRAISVIFRRQKSTTNAFVSRVFAVGGVGSDALDIALLELTPEGAAEIASEKDFLPNSRILPGVAADSSRLFAVYGAPGVLANVSLEEKEYGAVPMCYVTISCNPFPPDLSLSHDIALEYKIESNISAAVDGVVKAPNPHGLSGGGIWLITEPEEGAIWDPSKSQLIGVQNRWRRSADLVRGTQVQIATALLDSAAPNSSLENGV